MTERLCWICDEPSDTGEHRIKKSDLVERYGRGPYRNDEPLVHVKEGQMRPLQGPNSQLVKYEKNLCANCNNSFTQPFDRAYEDFIPWVMRHEQDILKRRVFDFEAVYGAEWGNRQRDLFKYFAKCFGCRLDEAGRAIPNDVNELLHKDSFETAFYVTFQINEDQLLLPTAAQAIGTHGLIAHKDAVTGNELGFQCGHYYRWFAMKYWYHHSANDPVGAPWIANAKHVYLGWYAPLTTEERADLIDKLNGD